MKGKNTAVILHPTASKSGRGKGRGVPSKYHREIGAISDRLKSTASRARNASAELKDEPMRAGLGLAGGVAGGMLVGKLVQDHVAKNPTGTIASNPLIQKATLVAVPAAATIYGIVDKKPTLMHAGVSGLAYMIGLIAASSAAPVPGPTVKGADDEIGAPSHAARVARRSALAKRWADKIRQEDPKAVSGSDDLVDHIQGELDSLNGDLDVGAPLAVSVARALAERTVPFLRAIENPQIHGMEDVGGDGTPAIDALLAVQGYDVEGLDGDIGAKKKLTRQERKASRLERKVAKVQRRVDKAKSKGLVKSGELQKKLEAAAKQDKAQDAALKKMQAKLDELSQQQATPAGDEYSDESGESWEDWGGYEDEGVEGEFDVSGDFDDISGDDDVSGFDDVSGDDDISGDDE